jgi:hypothetical protein
VTREEQWCLEGKSREGSIVGDAYGSSLRWESGRYSGSGKVTNHRLVTFGYLFLWLLPRKGEVLYLQGHYGVLYILNIIITRL